MKEKSVDVKPDRKVVETISFIAYARIPQDTVYVRIEPDFYTYPVADEPRYSVLNFSGKNRIEIDDKINTVIKQLEELKEELRGK